MSCGSLETLAREACRRGDWDVHPARADWTRNAVFKEAEALSHHRLSRRRGLRSTVVIELGKDIVRTTLAIVETRSGKKIEFQDDEARKGMKRPSCRASAFGIPRGTPDPLFDPLTDGRGAKVMDAARRNSSGKDGGDAAQRREPGAPRRV